MTADSLIQFIQWLLLLGSALTALKLYILDLYRRYPVLFTYFALRVPQSIWPLFLAPRSPAYFWLFLATSPLFLSIYILLVFELYRLVLENYKGLHSVLRWALYVFGAVSLAISIVSVLPQIKWSGTPRGATLRLAIAIERGVDTSLAIFLILLILLLSRYPVKLRRNVRLYAIAFPVLFLGTTVSILITTFRVKLQPEANVLLQLVYAGTVYTWLFLLSRAGEEVPVTTRQFGPEEEERLLNQLEALNTTMLKVSRRR